MLSQILMPLYFMEMIMKFHLSSAMFAVLYLSGCLQAQAELIYQSNTTQEKKEDTDHHNQAQTLALTTLTDTITHKPINDAYAIEVPEYLSLEQAQSVLKKVSPKIAANEAAVMASEFQSDATKSLKNPVIFAQASANTYQLQKDIDLTEVKNTVSQNINSLENEALSNLPIPITNPPHIPTNIINHYVPDSYDLDYKDSNVNAGLGVVYPLYTGGRTQAITDFVDARTNEFKADAILDENQLYSTLVERYFNAQLAIIAAYLRSDALDTIKQTDYMAQRLLEEGFISQVERLEAKSALADAQSEVTKANNTARLAMMALQRLLRTPYRIKPTTPLFVSSRPLPNLEYFQNLALANHPGLKKVAAKRQQAVQLQNLASAGNKPMVSVYGYGQIEKNPSWIAGVSATWKIWGGLDTKSSISASLAKIRQADLSEIEVSDNLLLLVEKNWNEVKNAQARYQSLQSNVDLAKEVLRYRQLGLQEGMNTALEVVQAQTQYLKARTEQAQAANEYVQALASLMQSCGTPLAFNDYMKEADIHLPTLYEQAERQEQSKVHKNAEENDTKSPS